MLTIGVRWLVGGLITSVAVVSVRYVKRLRDSVAADHLADPFTDQKKTTVTLYRRNPTHLPLGIGVTVRTSDLG